MEYISQRMRYARACGCYSDFLQRHRPKLLDERFLKNRLILFSAYFFLEISTPLLKIILSVYYIDDERWYWQLDFGSNMKYDD